MFEWQDQIEIWGFCDQMETSQPVEKHLEQMQKQPFALTCPQS